MAFGAATILMDTLHQHFLLPTPRFPLRNRRNVKSLYRNLSSLQTSLEQDFQVGENDEAIKGLEAQLRDVSVDLRFQIEHQLRLFYLGKAMKLRLHSAQKLLPILNRAIKDIETMDYRSVLDILPKHFTLPVSRMPAHIKKRVKSFCTQHRFLFYNHKSYYKEVREDEQESEDEQERYDEQESDSEKESNDEQESEDELESFYEQKSMDEEECNGEQESEDELESFYEQQSMDEEECNDEQESADELESFYEQQSMDEEECNDEQEREDELERFYEQQSKDDQESNDEQESKDEQESNDELESIYEQQSKDEQESNDEQESEDELESIYEQGIGDKGRRYMLNEAKSLIRQELRASYLNKYMKQRIQARKRIRGVFMLGIKLTSYIKKELLKVKNAYHHSNNSQSNNSASLRGLERDNITVGDSLRHTSMSTTIKMVGCDDEFNAIMEKLNQRSSKREIVSIVGMGGIGKTTLARRIYGDASFISGFDCRAWVTISQEYNPTRVFQGLVHSLAPRVYDNHEASNNGLPEQVYRRLKHQRYLIVVDDIWSTDVWDDLMRCFQDDNNGSRILLTTRLKSVAVYACRGSMFCHTMRFLDPYESWNLFCNKVLFETTIFSPEFETIAREIVDKCKGLPLAIIVAAGLFSNSKQNLNEWEHIAKHIHTLSLDHSNLQCENILNLSYTFLPHHLKLCFLSFGCFPEDYQVDEDMIVGFWVSEGFLKVLRCKSLEDVARESLQDLVDRNLVLICYEERNDADISKVYQMHDVLRELALREAQKENLLCYKKGYCIGLRCRRIQPWSIQSKICRYKCLTHSSTTTSSFIDLSEYGNTRPLHTHFKFLRALVLRDFTKFHNICMEIMGLVHLRWLKIASHFDCRCLPLFMLWNLQKLEVICYSSCEPLYIWRLPQLRNLSVMYGFTLVPPRSVHHNLESISFLDYRSCTKELFLRIPNLRTLILTIDHTINPKCKASNWFESLVYLYKLEELVVHNQPLRQEFRTIHSMGVWSLENLLPNLKKLELLNTRLKWEDMDVVGTLSRLEELILENAVDGRKWEPKDGGFHGLKLLGIFGCHLRRWEATDGHFPVLEFLVLKYMSFEEIPGDFADIATLKSIKLYECLDTVISSAKRIQEEQQEYGNDAFTLEILWAWEL